MTLVERKWRDDRTLSRIRDSFWDSDRWYRDWDDWPLDWPRPGELVRRWRSDFDRDGFWDWPSDWPRMDAVMPRFSSHLDRLDRNWRSDPFWRDLYPHWAEPIFKEGIDIRTNIINNMSRFAVEIDAYQFRPEEIQVKTIDDTLLIEGRHEDIRDRDNFTKMYFVRKYQLPTDVNPMDISSTIDSSGRLLVEARKQPRVQGRERMTPVEGPSRRGEAHISRNETVRSQEDSGSYGSRVQQQSTPGHRSHSSYSYQHSRTTTGDSPSGTYREHSIPVIETGMSSRTGERKASEEFHSRERCEREQYHAESKNEYRSQSSRQDSGFQESTSSSIKQNDGPRIGDTNSSNVRNVPILRKTFK
uniref:SHSP domain-containing protein n=1 Tax=Setaria digitata TaxID=48799 RepID=A0A915PFT8_9BILA